MKRLLYVEASPRKERSTSTAVARSFIGFEDLRSVVVDRTLAPQEDKDRSVAVAMEQARQMARTF